MRALPSEFSAYSWAPSTRELADRLGLDPSEIVRFDGNVPAWPLPSSRPGALAAALADVQNYPHGGYVELTAAVARYSGTGPENVVLGAGADDLILLCARAFAGPGDHVRISDEPTYPLFRIASNLAGAEIADDDPVLTFCCRPNNPSGALGDLPAARPLAVDEAYYEYAGETAAERIDEGVVVIRTLSKAFGLAGGRVGYALADTETAAELNRRQSPLRSRPFPPRWPSRHSPTRPTSRRRSTSGSALRAACAPSGWNRSRPGRTSSSSRWRRPRSWAARSCAPGLSCASSPTGFEHPSGIRRTTTCFSRALPARSTTRPRSQSPDAGASATCERPPRRACGYVSRSTERAASA